MALRTSLPPLLPLLLTLLLFPGSWALSKVPVLPAVAGQTFSLKCQYAPTDKGYQRKSWCREKSPLVCVRLVSSSQPRTMTQVSRFSIWDDPGAGYFTVTVTSLEEEDTGYYWCVVYHASRHSISKHSKFYLAVAPAPVSSQATRPSHKLVTSQTQSLVAQTGGASESSPGTPVAVTSPTELQNSTLDSSPQTSSALVPVLCGVLVTKSLMLLALLPWALWNPHGRPAQPKPHAQRFFLEP